MNAHAAGEAAPSKRPNAPAVGKRCQADTHAHALSHRPPRRYAGVGASGRCWTRTRLGSTGWSSRRHAPILLYAHVVSRHVTFLRPFSREPACRGENAMRATARGDAAGATNLRTAGAARLWLGGRQGADAAAADSARQAVLAPHECAHRRPRRSASVARTGSLQRLWYARAALQRAAKSPFEGRARPLLALGTCSGSWVGSCRAHPENWVIARNWTAAAS
jgi:hypothetical protein